MTGEKPTSQHSQGASVPSSLSDDQKLAIRDYLFSQVVVPGSAITVVSLIAGFFINEVAATRGENKAFTEAQTKLVGLIEESARNAEIIRQSQIRVGEIVKQTEAAGSLAQTNKVIEDVVDKLTKTEKFATTFNERVDSTWGTTEQTSTYGPGPHNGDLQSVACPPNHYVSGIRVQYGGTCKGMCDADGGVVRQMTVVCRRVNLSVKQP